MDRKRLRTQIRNCRLELQRLERELKLPGSAGQPAIINDNDPDGEQALNWTIITLLKNLAVAAEYLLAEQDSGDGA